VRVCLILEGTYPYVRGGVSSWAHQLILHLKDVEFFLLTISPEEPGEPAYELPPNVVGMRDINLAAPAQGEHRETESESVDRVLRFLQALDGERSELRLLEVLKEVRSARYSVESLVKEDEFWQYIVRAHLRRNPFYAFGEYYWNWFNAHATILRLLHVPAVEADVYHSLSTGYAGLIASLFSAERGIPFFLTEHGIYHRERYFEIDATPALKGQQRDEWIEMFMGLSRLAYESATRVVTLFYANQRSEIALGAPPGRCQVIPNGVEYDQYASVPRKPKPGYHIGLIGRVVPIKDTKTFIAACRTLSQDFPDAQFYCVGPLEEDPEYVEECRALTKSFGLEDRMHFTGNQDVREYYAFLDVLVLTSVSEAQPLVILEGFAAGVPCVATRVGDVPSLLDHDDRFIAVPKDAPGIARRIAFVLTEGEEVARWLERRREAVRTYYSRSAVFDRYRDLYHELAAEGSVWQE
jgi:glycosyltransferase involved in cell wall biosynthesis